MGKARVEDGRVILPRPPAGARKPEDGMTAREAAQRALEIQLTANRRLRANPVYRGFMVALVIAFLLAVCPLIDAWAFSRGMLDWNEDFAFTAAFVVLPYAASLPAIVMVLRRRRF